MPGEFHSRWILLVGTRDWLADFGGNIPGGIEQFEVGSAELKQLSTLREPNGALAVLRQLEYRPDLSAIRSSLVIGLENIQDPGNLGTIIRIADWFGIRDIFCSENSVELYNPKVIQSTMGSFLRVRVHYLDLADLIGRLRKSGRAARTGVVSLTGSGSEAGPAGSPIEYYPVFATGGNGRNLYETDLPYRGMLLLGNESKGLSEKLMEEADRVLKIPFHDPGLHPDSLNIASAAAIICSEFRRKT